MPTVDSVVGAYIKLRDHKNDIKERHTAELAPINEKMSLMENWLHKRMLEQGAKNIKTEFGTAYRKVSISVKMEDRDVAFDFIKKHELWDLLESRVSKTAVEDWMESHDKQVPPGISYSETEVVQVRR